MAVIKALLLAGLLSVIKSEYINKSIFGCNDKVYWNFGDSIKKGISINDTLKNKNDLCRSICNNYDNCDAWGININNDNICNIFTFMNGNIAYNCDIKRDMHSDMMYYGEIKECLSNKILNSSYIVGLNNKTINKPLQYNAKTGCFEKIANSQGKISESLLNSNSLPQITNVNAPPRRLIIGAIGDLIGDFLESLAGDGDDDDDDDDDDATAAGDDDDDDDDSPTGDDDDDDDDDSPTGGDDDDDDDSPTGGDDDDDDDSPTGGDDDDDDDSPTGGDDDDDDDTPAGGDADDDDDDDNGTPSPTSVTMAPTTTPTVSPTTATMAPTNNPTGSPVVGGQTCPTCPDGPDFPPPGGLLAKKVNMKGIFSDTDFEIDLEVGLIIAFVVGEICACIILVIVCKVCCNGKRKKKGYVAVNMESTTDATLTDVTLPDKSGDKSADNSPKLELIAENV